MRRPARNALIGAIAVFTTATAAWTAGRSRLHVEPPPMEELLEVAGEAEPEAVTWDLPVTRNESVDRWIGFLQGGNKQRTRLWLERTGRYGPMIRAELRQRGMPEDLLYLALIESGLSSRAYSKAAASGMWQFIAETGRRYGLEVTAEVDDRRDPVKSTGAALTYLQELYDRFGSWYLAAAAYNTGENRVGRIMRETFGTERGTDAQFWEIAHRLPRETRDYVPLMLAAGHIGKEPEKYGFTGLNHQDPLSYEVVWVPGGVELSAIARASGVAASEVKELNLHFMRDRTPPNRGSAVRIPAGTRVAFEAAFPEIHRAIRVAQASPAPRQPAAARSASAPDARTAAAAGTRTHRVRAGETLTHISRRYGVSVAAIRGANGNIDPRRLRAGQALRIPATGSGSSVARASSSTLRYHSVRRGENLSVIARQHGVSVRQIQSWNQLRGTRIHPGQRLRVRT
jgi:membrane-bound lytic murein transglycosylase D